MNKIAICRQPCGIGDIMLCQKIATDIVTRGYNVIWPVVPQYEYIKDYIKTPGVVFCDENDTFPYKDVYLANSNKAIKKDGFVYLPLQHADQNVQCSSMLIAKFLYYGMNVWEDWHRFLNIERNSYREQKLYDHFKVKPGDKFNIISKSYGTPPCSKINPNIYPTNNYRCIEMELLGWDNLFDWCGLFEEAQEVHAVDSSISLILTKLDIKNVTLYERCDMPNADYSKPCLNYLHKSLFLPEWTFYTHYTSNGFF